MARGKKNGKNVSYYMDIEIYDRLKCYAEAKGQSMTTAIERIIVDYLNEHAYSFGQDQERLNDPDNQKKA